MKLEKNIQTNYLGDEAPTWKHFLIVFITAALLIAMSWIAHYKFGWLPLKVEKVTTEMTAVDVGHCYCQ